MNSKACLLILASFAGLDCCSHNDLRPVDQEAIIAKEAQIQFEGPADSRRAAKYYPDLIEFTYSRESRLQEVLSIIKKKNGDILVVITNFEKTGECIVSMLNINQSFEVNIPSTQDNESMAIIMEAYRKTKASDLVELWEKYRGLK